MSKLAVSPGLGLPEWTEMGQSSGLDPLGMARPTEAVYQSLLPGISTITNRLRYYSFFPWLLDSYARHSGETDPATFFRFQRRSEGLFALIGVSGGGEAGLTGANWALTQLSQSKDKIEFGGTAELTDGKGYLKNKGGALGAIYGPQLREMGLIGSSSEHSLPIPTERGDRLSSALNSSVGEIEQLFFEAVATGSVARSDLQLLSSLKPSAIDPESPEQSMLAKLLLGMLEDASEVDLARRQTMVRILNRAELTRQLPTAYDLRWSWFERGAIEDSGGLDSFDPWTAYQINDLIRIAYETLLQKAIEILADSPENTYRLSTLSGDLLDSIGNDSLNGAFIADAAAGASIRNLSAAIETTGDSITPVSDEALSAAVRLLRTMLFLARRRQSQMDTAFPPISAFQSISSELRFVERLAGHPPRDILSAIIQDRILKRHLWVASRKFSGQSAYTYLFEPDDGRLRHRGSFVVAPSSPRLSQAIQFLLDARLLDRDAGISSLGTKLLGYG